MFVRFFVLVVFYGIGIYILCCVLVVSCPGVIILLLCAIVVRFFAVGAIGIDIIFGWSLLPICPLWYGVLCLLCFGLFGLTLFRGGRGGMFSCVFCGGGCVWCVLVIFGGGGGGVGKNVEA